MILGHLRQATIEEVSSLPTDGKKYRIVAYNNDIYFHNGTEYIKVAVKDSSPVFTDLTVNGSIVVTGNVDGRDISNDGSSLDAHLLSPTGHSYINQDVTTTSNPTFNNITVASITGGNAKLSSVYIGATGRNNNARIQIDSTTEGFLGPRMTTLQRTDISGPVGLLVYDTDFDAYYQYKSTGWTIVGSGEGVTGVNGTAPIQVIDGVVPNVSITKASATGDGYVSQSDWAVFNAKQAALTSSSNVPANTIQLNTSPTVGSFAEGKIYYDIDNKTIAAEIDTDVVLQIGQEENTLVYNNTVSTILNGQAVYVTGVYNGGTNDVPTIALAKADSENTAFVFGVATQNINASSYGLVTVRGNINNLNTNITGWTAGDRLYLSATGAGELTNVIPDAPNLEVRVGRLLTKSATVGRINIRINQAYRLGDLADVTTTSPTVDQVLRYNGAEWVNGAPATSSATNGIAFYPDTTDIIPSSAENSFVLETLNKYPVTTAESVEAIACTNNTVIGSGYLYNTALGRTSIDAGSWSFDFYLSVSSTSAGRVSVITNNIYKVSPYTSPTITITGSGTSRTCTASSGTPFATANIDASATNTAASFVQTPKGVYQITARTSDTVVTISTPAAYVNESTVGFSVWKKLFGAVSPTITNLTTNYGLYSIITSQAAFTVAATDKLGMIVFGTSNNTTTVNYVYNGNARYSHFDTPLITLHNNLAGLQGGTSDEFYHLTASGNTRANQSANASRDGYLAKEDWTTFNNKADSGLLDGTDKLLGSLTIAATGTNVLYDLYTPSAKDSFKNKLVAYNGNASSVAKVRVAYRDGVVANEDYLIYDLSIGPKSASIGLELPIVKDGDTISVLSDTPTVTFSLLGEETTTTNFADREGAIDIDGSTNAINTDKDLATFTAENEVDILICNRNASLTAKYIIKVYNGSTAYTLTEEQILPNQSKVFAYDINVANTYKIQVQSDTTNVNFACFSRGITGSSLGLDIPVDYQLKQALTSAKIEITSDYILTNAWANITGLTYTCVKSSKYNFKSMLPVYLPTVNDNCWLRYAVNGIKVGNAQPVIGNATDFYCFFTLVQDDVYLNIGDVVSVQAQYTDAGGKIDYTSGLAEPVLQVVESQNLIDYVKNPYQVDYYQTNLTVTGTNWTTTRAVGLAYKTPDGVWRLRFNIDGAVPSSTYTGITLTVLGVTFKNGTNQVCSALCIGPASPTFVRAKANSNASTIELFHVSASNLTNYECSGDVELDSKPTWI